MFSSLLIIGKGPLVESKSMENSHDFDMLWQLCFFSSPGFGIVLTAETTDGVILTAESMSKPSGSGENPAVPEDVGIKAAHNLLDEIFRVYQSLTILIGRKS